MLQLRAIVGGTIFNGRYGQDITVSWNVFFDLKCLDLKPTCDRYL